MPRPPGGWRGTLGDISSDSDDDPAPPRPPRLRTPPPPPPPAPPNVSPIRTEDDELLYGPRDEATKAIISSKDEQIKRVWQLLRDAGAAVRRERQVSEELRAENKSLTATVDELRGRCERISSERDELRAQLERNKKAAAADNTTSLAVDTALAQNNVLRRRIEVLQSKLRKQELLEAKVDELTLENSLAVDYISRLRLTSAATTSSPPPPPFALSKATVRSASAEPSPDVGLTDSFAKALRSSGMFRDRSPLRSPSARRRSSSAPRGRAASTPPRAPWHPVAPKRHGAMERWPGEEAPLPRVRTTSVSPLRRGGPAQLSSRMKRMYGAPPSPRSLGGVVHKMVEDLIASLRSRGQDLPLVRVADCVYTIGTRKLNLSVNGAGQLVVKTGGGHQDLLDYLQKHYHRLTFTPKAPLSNTESEAWGL